MYHFAVQIFIIFSCDSLDQIEKQTKMRKLAVGDWLYWQKMGAYTTVAASRFNGFETPRNVHFIDEAAWQALQRASC